MGRVLGRAQADIDARKARATCASDWDAIIKLILVSGTLDELNENVRDSMQGWFESDTSFDAEEWMRMAERSQMREFAGLVRDYKEECFYFEIVDWVRKMLLGGMLMFVERGSFAQILLGTALSIAFLIVQIVLQPYKLAHHNVLKTMGEATILLAFLCSFQLQAGAGAGAGASASSQFIVLDWLLFASFGIMALAMPAALARWLWSQCIASSHRFQFRSASLCCCCGRRQRLFPDIDEMLWNSSANPVFTTRSSSAHSLHRMATGQADDALLEMEEELAVRSRSPMTV